LTDSEKRKRKEQDPEFPVPRLPPAHLAPLDYQTPLATPDDMGAHVGLIHTILYAGHGETLTNTGKRQSTTCFLQKLPLGLSYSYPNGPRLISMALSQ
jgi:hypothetical protein